MTDEHLMRHWTDAHVQFSGDLDRGLLRLCHFLARRLKRRQAIGKAYALAVATDAPKNATARAAVAGILACVATTALLVSVAVLATSGAIDAAALHSSTPAVSPILAHVTLA